MADIENRVYVLETKQEEILRRQTEHDERQKKGEDLMYKIATNTDVMSSTLQMLTDKIMPKVEAMEKKVEANTMITKAALWICGALITAGFTAIVAIL